MEQTVIPCPFCGSDNIGYSIKTMGRRANKYHVAMYCKDCNCYGKRTIVDGKNEFRSGIEKIPEYKQLAIDAWNTRKSIERLVNKLTNEINTIADARTEALQRNQVSLYDACGERLVEAILCRAIVEEENDKCMK